MEREDTEYQPEPMTVELLKLMLDGMEPSQRVYINQLGKLVPVIGIYSDAGIVELFLSD